MSVANKKNWKEYEIYVFNYIREKYPLATTLKNLKVMGINSKVLRQIDVLICVPPLDLGLTIAIECKYYNKRIDVKIIDSLIGCLDDIKASKGILVSNKGFSDGAIYRAGNCGRDIELWELEMDRIKVIEDLHILTCSKTTMLKFKLPIGWTTEEDPKQPMCTLYPHGLKLTGSLLRDEFIFIEFNDKDESINDIQSLIDDVAKYSRQKYPNLAYENLSNSLLPEKHPGYQSILRRYEYKKGIFEYSYILDFEQTLIQFVLHTPQKNAKQYLEDFKDIISSSEVFSLKV